MNNTHIQIRAKQITKKLMATLLIVFLTTGSVFTQAATDTNICREIGVTFAFFNGVNTTEIGANIAKEEFKRIHGSTSDNGDEISYEVLYNYSNGFEDFVETFEQRLLEQGGLLEGRYELFFEALNGGGSWWSTIIDTFSSAADILNGIVDWVQAAAVQQVATLLGNPPTTANYAEHRTRIDTYIIEGKKLLFVAHSQGNLFANAAYDYALTKTDSDSVKVVHIAPASPLLNGNHTLADLDLVINGLRLAGSVASITDYIPGYLLRPSGINGKKDILGHGLLEIYINQSLDISIRVKDHINIALNSLIAPPEDAVSGFFTATLTWNGSGDVDLHSYEPNAFHVYYRSKSGDSGYLDVDNVVANGPEHYYASCDADTLQTGTYQIAIANYAGADGRTATVQIASWSDGVLGTKSVVLGSATRHNPVYSMFNVVVNQDEETEKYSVSIE